MYGCPCKLPLPCCRGRRLPSLDAATVRRREQLTLLLIAEVTS